MTEYFNNNFPLNNLIYPGGVYPWMRILAGGGQSKFNGIAMTADLDMQGFNIINAGGGGPPVQDYLVDSVVWSQGNPGPAETGVVKGTFTDLSNYLSVNPHVKVIWVDTTYQIAVVDTQVDFQSKVEFRGMFRNNATSTYGARVDVVGVGQIRNPSRVVDIDIQGKVAHSAPMFLLNSILNTSVTFDSVLLSDLEATVPHIEVNTPGVINRLIFKNSLLAAQPQPNPSILFTAHSGTSLEAQLSLFGSQFNPDFFGGSGPISVFTDGASTAPQVPNLALTSYQPPRANALSAVDKWLNVLAGQQASSLFVAIEDLLNILGRSVQRYMYNNFKTNTTSTSVQASYTSIAVGAASVETENTAQWDRTNNTTFVNNVAVVAPPDNEYSVKVVAEFGVTHAVGHPIPEGFELGLEVNGVLQHNEYNFVVESPAIERVFCIWYVKSWKQTEVLEVKVKASSILDLTFQDGTVYIESVNPYNQLA